MYRVIILGKQYEQRGKEVLEKNAGDNVCLHLCEKGGPTAGYQWADDATVVCNGCGEPLIAS